MSLPESDKIIPASRLDSKRRDHGKPVREMILLDNLVHDLVSAPPSRPEELQSELNEYGVNLKALKEALRNIKF